MTYRTVKLFPDTATRRICSRGSGRTGHPNSTPSIPTWTTAGTKAARTPGGRGKRSCRSRGRIAGGVVGDGAVVEKSYEGPDAELRLRREHALLTRLQDRLPVPPVQGMTEARLTPGFVAGAHGQELLAAGQPEAVLASCGELLRNIHGTAPSVLPEDAPSAEKVLVHGDFGPNNVLLDPATFEVTAVVDWEFAHLGDPIEDLAWCEWI